MNVKAIAIAAGSVVIIGGAAFAVKKFVVDPHSNVKGDLENVVLIDITNVNDVYAALKAAAEKFHVEMTDSQAFEIICKLQMWGQKSGEKLMGMKSFIKRVNTICEGNDNLKSIKFEKKEAKK